MEKESLQDSKLTFQQFLEKIEYSPNSIHSKIFKHACEDKSSFKTLKVFCPKSETLLLLNHKFEIKAYKFPMIDDKIYRQIQETWEIPKLKILVLISNSKLLFFKLKKNSPPDSKIIFLTSYILPSWFRSTLLVWNNGEEKEIYLLCETFIKEIILFSFVYEKKKIRHEKKSTLKRKIKSWCLALYAGTRGSTTPILFERKFGEGLVEPKILLNKGSEEPVDFEQVMYLWNSMLDDQLFFQLLLLEADIKNSIIRNNNPLRFPASFEDSIRFPELRIIAAFFRFHDSTLFKTRLETIFIKFCEEIEQEPDLTETKLVGYQTNNNERNSLKSTNLQKLSFQDENTP
jgi:hypothetical protein